jgi:hypothetical protein
MEQELARLQQLLAAERQAHQQEHQQLEAAQAEVQRMQHMPSMKGLKTALRLQMQLHAPQTLEAAMSKAIAADTAMYSSFGARSSNAGFGGFAGSSKGAGSSHGGDGHSPTPMELGSLQPQPRHQQQQQHPAAGQHPTSQGGKPYCSYCRRSGHDTRVCRRAKRAQHGPGSTGQQ